MADKPGSLSFWSIRFRVDMHMKNEYIVGKSFG
jgi:hypothetical protein